jgi:hypothetical protein
MGAVTSFLAGIWGKLAAGAAIVGGILLAISRLKKAGKDEARAETAAATLATERRMRDANAAGPKSAGDVDQRLRDGGF